MDLPVTKDHRSVALAAMPDGGIVVSVLGTPAFYLDAENAREFAEYAVSMARHSRARKSIIDAR